MLEISTEITINSSAETVWNHLTNLKKYLEWNPFLTQADGEVKEGGKIKIKAQPPGLAAMSLTPTITKVEQNRELRWEGKLIIPGMFDGEHIFIIEELEPNKVRFIQKEFYSGVLVPLLAGKLNKNTRQGFELMNQGLKKITEAHPLPII